jgi:YafQ family addiction module toxin component
MKYLLDIPPFLDKKFTKIAKRDRKQIEAIDKTIADVLEKPLHFKPLRGDKKGARRVHVWKAFVLVYDVKGNIVKLLDYDHHDNIY